MADRESKTGLKAEDIASSELYGVLLSADGEAKPLSPNVITQKLFAAEDFYEHELGISLRPVRVFSDAESRASAQPPLQIDQYDPIADLSEAAYDYDAGMWDHSRWGFIKLRRRPIRSVTSIAFTWMHNTLVWSVPATWIKPDRKAGTVQIVPMDGPATTMALGIFLTTMVAGGRGLPHAIYVDYEAGYTTDELAHRHQDLLEGIRLRVLLQLGGIISAIAGGGQTGGSLSLDGLSHSRSFGGKYGAYSGLIQQAIDREKEILSSWKAHEKGVPMAFA